MGRYLSRGEAQSLFAKFLCFLMIFGVFYLLPFDLLLAGSGVHGSGVVDVIC